MQTRDLDITTDIVFRESATNHRIARPREIHAQFHSHPDKKPSIPEFGILVPMVGNIVATVRRVMQNRLDVGCWNQVGSEDVGEYRINVSENGGTYILPTVKDKDGEPATKVSIFFSPLDIRTGARGGPNLPNGEASNAHVLDASQKLPRLSIPNSRDASKVVIRNISGVNQQIIVEMLDPTIIGEQRRPLNKPSPISPHEEVSIELPDIGKASMQLRLHSFGRFLVERHH